MASWFTPAACLALTVGIYLLASRVHRRFGKHPLLNPTACSILVLIALLAAGRIPYSTYSGGTAFIHFLLGPATVALGVALHAHLPRIRAAALPAIMALTVGSLTGILSAVLLAKALGADRVLISTLAPKSATTPIAMGIAQTSGGEPALTAVVVILTGILGAVLGHPLLTWMGIRDPRARGFSLGLASHGLGTAAAFEEGPETGTFAGLAMGLNGLLTALLVPLVLRLF